MSTLQSNQNHTEERPFQEEADTLTDIQDKLKQITDESRTLLEKLLKEKCPFAPDTIQESIYFRRSLFLLLSSQLLSLFFDAQARFTETQLNILIKVAICATEQDINLCLASIQPIGNNGLTFTFDFDFLFIFDIVPIKRENESREKTEDYLITEYGQELQVTEIRPGEKLGDYLSKIKEHQRQKEAAKNLQSCEEDLEPRDDTMPF